MKKRRFAALGLAFLIGSAGLTSCAVPEKDAEEQETKTTVEAPEEKEPPVTLPEQDVAVNYSSSDLAAAEEAEGVAMSEDFVQAAADFGIALLQRQEQGENVMISPVSLLYALGMTANGADGKTLSEMEDVLFGGISVDTANGHFLHFSENLPDGTGGVSLDIANSIWFNNKNAAFSVNAAFLGKNATYYGAGAFGRDFSNPASVDAVNQWVSDNTDGMIPRIINQLKPEDIMLLVNTVLFDGKWKDTYSESDIRPFTFTAYDGGQKETEMLCSRENSYFELGRGKGFCRPYAERYSFVGLLPDAEVDVYDYLADLTGEKLIEALNSKKYAKTLIRIPEFTFDYDTDATEALKALGMSRAFSGSADFSRLGTYEGGNISIGSVIQKTRIELTRDGTKAAAATVVTMMATSAGPGTYVPPVEIYLDRPFVFAIVDNETNLPLFCGVVTEIPD